MLSYEEIFILHTTLSKIYGSGRFEEGGSFSLTTLNFSGVRLRALEDPLILS